MILLFRSRKVIGSDIALILTSLPFWLLVAIDIRQESPTRWVAFYQYLVAGDIEIQPATLGELFQRIYILIVSAIGMLITTMGFINLLRWLLLPLGDSARIVSSMVLDMAVSVAQLGVGLPIWFLFWSWAQPMAA